MEKRKLNTKSMVLIGMMGTLSSVLMFVNFPMPFVPPFYKFDIAELPALFGGFLMGPLAGILIIFIKLIIKIILQGSETLMVGEFANFIGSVSFILPAALIYRWNKSKKGAVIGMIAAVILSSVVSIFGNAYIAIPLYASVYGWPLQSIIDMGAAVNPYITDMTTLMLFAVFPFNLIKCGVTSLLTYLIYKRTGKLLKQFVDKEAS